MSSDRTTPFDGVFPRFVAGATFGYYVTHLAFLLNPQIDIFGLRLVAVGLFYAVICGTQFGLLLWLLRLARVRIFGPGDGPRGFGWIVFATAFAAAAYLRHLETLQIYLPIDAVRALSNATRVVVATWLLLFVLWLVERSTPERLSKLVLIAGLSLIALSAFFLQQRKNLYRVDERDPVVVDVGPVEKRHPVIVVAIRSLPFDWLVQLRAEMPLEWIDAASRQDYVTRLLPFPTTSTRSIWASLASGKLPYRHGVTGLYSYQTWVNRDDERFLLIPRGTGFGEWGFLPPVRKSSAHLPSGDVLPLWSLFKRVDLDSLVVNWPESAVSESPVGVLVSDRFIEGGNAASNVRPPDLAGRLTPVRAQTIEPIVLRRFASLPTRLRQTIVSGMRADLGAVRIVSELARERHPALTALSINGLGSFLDALDAGNNDLPPSGSPEGGAVRAYVEQIDHILARLANEFPDAILLIASPVGPNPEEIPRDMTELLIQRLRPPEPGSDDGFLIVAGPGTVRSDSTREVKVVDVVPTVLYAAGLPVGRDMDGRVITEAFRDEVLRENPFKLIQSYEAPTLSVRDPE